MCSSDLSKIPVPSYLVAYVQIPEERFFAAGPKAVDPALVEKVEKNVFSELMNGESSFYEVPYYVNACRDLLPNATFPQAIVSTEAERLMDLAEAFAYCANRKLSTCVFFGHLFDREADKCARSVRNIDFVIPEQDWRGLGIIKFADEMRTEHMKILDEFYGKTHAFSFYEYYGILRKSLRETYWIASNIISNKDDPHNGVVYHQICAELTKNGLPADKITTNSIARHIKKRAGEFVSTHIGNAYVFFRNAYLLSNVGHDEASSQA